MSEFLTPAEGPADQARGAAARPRRPRLRGGGSAPTPPEGTEAPLPVPAPAGALADVIPGPGADEPTSRPPVDRRQRAALAVAIACAVASTSGLVASTLVRSPQEQRARAGAPAASLLSAPVERRVLESTIVTRGKVEAAALLEVTPVVEGARAQVVTRVAVTVGDEVTPGQVLLAVSGRPLIVLPGPLPAYRDLKPASEGDDVRQLQEALAALGHYADEDDAGYYGGGTKSAVRSLYDAIGYDVAAADNETALIAAEEAVETAEVAVANVERRIEAGETAGPSEEPLGSQLTRLRAQMRRAQASRNDIAARSGPMVPLSEFVFVPDLPGRVAALTAKVGETVDAPLVTLASGKLSVLVRARPEQAEQLRPGMPVKLSSETLGASADATVSTIGDLTTSAEGDGEGDGDGEPHRPVVVTSNEPLPTAWAGLDVRATIVSSHTDTEVLVVPLSAVSAGADGRTTVSVLGDGGRVTRVEVKAGISGAGFVEVSPVAGELAEGSRVVVGTQP